MKLKLNSYEKFPQTVWWSLSMWTGSSPWSPWLWNNFFPFDKCQMVTLRGKGSPILSATTWVADADLSAQILRPKHSQTVSIPLATRFLCLSHLFSWCVDTWKERNSRAMRKKSKIKISEWASILVTEYWPIHGEIATTEPVPKQFHSRLQRTGAEHGAVIPKEIS